MSIRLEHMLATWQQQKAQSQWVLATVIKTEGSSYRKAGAMMLINDLGQYFGLISGGCLESDVMRQARRCWESGDARIVTYDMREEDDIGWQLGIGCGGMVQLLLQPINANNHYQNLETLYQRLVSRKSSYYIVDTKLTDGQNRVFNTQHDFNTSNIKSNLSCEEQLGFHIETTPRLAIVGGGVDAIPVAKIAHTLGWHTSVFDPRVNYAKDEVFQPFAKPVKLPLDVLNQQLEFDQADAIVIMTHNVELDAQALQCAQQSEAKFVGLLGPVHRTEKVLKAAGLGYESLTKPLSNPVGLNLGGELPESIALAIISQVHGVLEQAIKLNSLTDQDQGGLKHAG